MTARAKKDFQANRADGQNGSFHDYETAQAFLGTSAGVIRQRPTRPQPPREAGKPRPWPVVHRQ